ncbi:hypothetical protein [Streptacidiphilus sp. EB129]|uniref:hypothetical protein n=1 Tax=Streptacidiphilus sp. EB129 TaxID=3156262 RepID=UPI0035180466
MAMAMCPICSDDEDVEVVRVLDSGRRLVRHRCGQQWEHGEPVDPKRASAQSFDSLRARFPRAEDVHPERLDRVARLKAQYLTTRPGFDPAVAAYWERYQKVFSREGLWACNPRDLKDFANTIVGAHPGNQSTFNSSWNDIGDAAAAESTRRTVEYLLRGPEDVPCEDRLEQLLSGTKPFAMSGFKEALLTKGGFTPDGGHGFVWLCGECQGS